MTGALRYEWVRISTVRSTWALIGMAMLVPAGLALLVAGFVGRLGPTAGGPGIAADLDRFSARLRFLLGEPFANARHRQEVDQHAADGHFGTHVEEDRQHAIAQVAVAQATAAISESLFIVSLLLVVEHEKQLFPIHLSHLRQF